MYSYRTPFFRRLIAGKGAHDMLDPIIVGKVIQQCRESRGVSQEVLSGLADIGRTHLSAIERGARRPTLETFYRIAEGLQIKPSVLLASIENEMSRLR